MKRVALLAGVLILASCGGGNGPAKNAGPTNGLASTTSASTTATTQVESTTTQSSISTSGSSGSGDTCVNLDPSKADPPIPTPVDPKTSAHAAYGFTVEYPSTWYDGTDQAKVTAGGVLDPTTLAAAGLKPTDTLQNMNVEDKTNYPGLTVYRFPNVGDTPDAIATRMASVLRSSGAQTSPLRSWCLDGTPSRGFLALASSGTLQESWFTIHDGALYYAFFIAKSDGTQATQDRFVLNFASVLTTWKWS